MIITCDRLTDQLYISPVLASGVVDVSRKTLVAQWSLSGSVLELLLVMVVAVLGDPGASGTLGGLATGVFV
jgi:hypothetical protein